MQRTSALLAIVIVAAAFAGCTGNKTTPTPTSNTVTPSATPAATPTATGTVPTVTPAVTPVVPTPVGNLTQPSLASIHVVSLTDAVATGGTADVCWRVDGNGTLGHTAVHFDTVSHPNATSFTEYPQAVYPDNGPATTTGTFKLPGTFCAQLKTLNQTIYLRAHALAAGTPPSQMLSVEKIVPVGANSTITFVNFREIFPMSFDNNVCWRVSNLNGTSTHTAVHFDTVSHPNSTSFTDYKLGAGYPTGFTAANVSVTLPGEFCTDIKMNQTLYMRAHVIDANSTHHLSEERVVEPASRLSITGGLPAVATPASVVNVCWRAEGSGISVHTAVHWDTASHPDATTFTVYPNAIYPNNGPATTSGNFTLPGPFCANLTLPASGTVYFRPHAIFAGGFSEIGPEYSIRVAP